MGGRRVPTIWGLVADKQASGFLLRAVSGILGEKRGVVFILHSFPQRQRGRQTAGGKWGGGQREGAVSAGVLEERTVAWTVGVGHEVGEKWRGVRCVWEFASTGRAGGLDAPGEEAEVVLVASVSVCVGGGIIYRSCPMMLSVVSDELSPITGVPRRSLCALLLPSRSTRSLLGGSHVGWAAFMTKPHSMSNEWLVLWVEKILGSGL